MQLLDSTSGADLQQQRYDSRLQSAEFVYKSWGWNVIAVSYGGRYLNLNEKLGYGSLAAGQIGQLQIGTDNEVVLGQIGVDMFLPLGRWSLDTTWKGAIGANVASSSTFLSNAGIIELNRSIQRTEFAGLVEGGTFARYFITPRLTARVGYEFWWIHGVALAPRQIGAVISQNTGRHLEGTTEVLFYGASAGVEYVW